MAKYKWNKNLQNEFDSIMQTEDEVPTIDSRKQIKSIYLDEYIDLNKQEFECSDKKKVHEIRAKIAEVRIKMYDELKQNIVVVKFTAQNKFLEETKMEENMVGKLKEVRKKIEAYYKSSVRPLEVEAIERLKEVKNKKKGIIKIRNDLYLLRAATEFTPEQIKLIETFDLENYRV